MRILFLEEAVSFHVKHVGLQLGSLIRISCVVHHLSKRDMHNDNPFDSPNVEKFTFKERGTRNVFWGLTIFLCANCLLLAWFLPGVAMVLAMLVVLPGLANGYIDYRRRLLAGPVDGLTQWGTMVVAFLQLIPFVPLGGLVMFLIAEAVVAYARATMPDGVSAWDVMAGYLMGLIGGILTYAAAVLIMLVWKVIGLNKSYRELAVSQPTT
ncbi:hypothetical protein DTL21_03990 [Bremerella cremea]|uniref:Uncharacterized protein n=2 Tax=Pirellulales TaxID=2691354 RepID=A0A2S8G677_9BACT|nr:hypothetical protein C5Y83_03990 [Blastopirellula marina]RCS51369.1 hypothetical protein DTL21_03990 [Bremerella cremea]